MEIETMIGRMSIAAAGGSSETGQSVVDGILL